MSGCTEICVPEKKSESDTRYWMLDSRYSMEDRNSEPTELHLASIQHPVSSIEYLLAVK
jgi:hypothetical protein